MKRTVVAVALMSIGLTAAHAQEVVVKLGGAAPLTGNQSHLGKDLENGTRLAIEEANAKGVTIGGKKIKFELVGEDDQADPRTPLTNATAGVVDSIVSPKVVEKRLRAAKSADELDLAADQIREVADQEQALALTNLYRALRAQLEA